MKRYRQIGFGTACTLCRLEIAGLGFWRAGRYVSLVIGSGSGCMDGECVCMNIDTNTDTERRILSNPIS